MNHSDVLEMRLGALTGRGKWAVVANLPGAQIRTSEIRLADPKERKKFAEKILEECPGLDGCQLFEQLELLASEAVCPGNADGMDGSDGGSQESSKAAELFELAGQLFEFGKTQEGSPFVVAKEGDRSVHLIGDGNEEVQSTLAHHYWKTKKKTIGSQAIHSTIQLLCAEAREAPSQPVYRRVAPHGDGIVVDLADDRGRCVLVSPEGWSIADRSPVLFERGVLHSPMPVPIKGGDIGEFLGLLNLKGGSADLLVGWMVASYFPGDPCAIGVFDGQYGAGKSSAARMVVELLDPSPAPLRCLPKNLDDWVVASAGSRMTALDNVSAIPDWFSDALCRAVTGEAMAKRKLYSNSGISVVTLKCPLLLTSIDMGLLRGDLADRIALFTLDRIPAEKRLAESDFQARFKSRKPRFLGAFFDLLVGVLRARPLVEARQLPRLADFGRTLLAVDQVRKSESFRAFYAQREQLAVSVLESTDLGAAMLEWIQLVEDLDVSLTATELRATLSAGHPHVGQLNPRKIAGELRRMIPALADLGVEVITPSESNRGADRKRSRKYRLRTLTQRSTVQTVQTVRNVWSLESNVLVDPRTSAEGRKPADEADGADGPPRIVLDGGGQRSMEGEARPGREKDDLGQSGEGV